MSGFSGQDPLKIIITGGPGTGKITVIKAVKTFLNANDGNSVFCLGTTVIAAFLMLGATSHSVLGLPVNHTFFHYKDLHFGNFKNVYNRTKSSSLMKFSLWV